MDKDPIKVNNYLEAGLVRNVGLARLYFESISPNVKRKSDVLSMWLKKIDPSEFNNAVIHKAIRLLPSKIKCDESIFQSSTSCPMMSEFTTGQRFL